MLLVDPSPEGVTKSLMSSELHRAAGPSGITAELIRAALPWLLTFLNLVWQGSVACANVAQAWKHGVITTLFQKLDPCTAVNYRGGSLLAVFGKCFILILARRLISPLGFIFLEHYSS